MSQELHDLQKRLQGALEECQRLREEVRRLKQQSGPDNPIVAEPLTQISETYLPTADSLTTSTAPAQKGERVALFRSLFRGREDVYAKRIQFKSGEWGYVPYRGTRLDCASKRESRSVETNGPANPDTVSVDR